MLILSQEDKNTLLVGMIPILWDIIWIFTNSALWAELV